MTRYSEGKTNTRARVSSSVYDGPGLNFSPDFYYGRKRRSSQPRFQLLDTKTAKQSRQDIIAVYATRPVDRRMNLC